MKTAQLKYNADSECYTLDNEQLHCGDCLEVLIFNGLTNQAEWISTRIELNGADEWYLVGLIGYQVNGLFARR